MNKVYLKGYVGQDPTTYEGKSKVATFSMAYKIYPENTGWIKVVGFKKTAEYIESNICQGTALIVEGSLSYNAWTDKDGNKRTETQIIANNIIPFYMKKKRDADDGSGEPRDENIPF